MQKLLILFSVIILSYINFVKANEIKILYKLENDIITNQDIIDELNYLISLNNNLTSLERIFSACPVGHHIGRVTSKIFI